MVVHEAELRTHGWVFFHTIRTMCSSCGDKDTPFFFPLSPFFCLMLLKFLATTDCRIDARKIFDLYSVAGLHPFEKKKMEGRKQR